MSRLSILFLTMLVATSSVLAAPPAKTSSKVTASPPAPTPPPPAETPPPPPPASPPAETRRSLRLAVYDLAAEGVEPRLARVVTDAVVLEVRKLERVSVVNMEDVRAMLDVEAQKQLVGCDDDSCLSEIADSLGVDGVVVGSLAKIGDEHIFGLRRIDQRQAKSLGQVTKRFVAENGEEFLAAIGPAIEELFPEHALRAGQTRGVDVEVGRRLNPPPLSPWIFYGTTAVGSGLAAGSVGALVVNLVLSQQVAERQQLATTVPQPGKDIATLRAQNDTAAIATAGLAGAAAVVFIGAGIEALFTDWRGDADD